MKLYQKLLLGFACVALLVSCVGYAMQQTNRQVLRGVDKLSVTSVAEISAASELARSLRESVHALRQSRSGPDRDAAARELSEALNAFDLSLAAARSATTARPHDLTPDRAERARKLELLREIGDAFHSYRMAIDATLQQAPVPASSLDEQFEPLVARVAEPIDQYRRTAQLELTLGAADLRRQLTQADRFLFASVLLGIGLTLVLGILISNSIVAPLQLLGEATRTLGRGRLDYRVRLSSTREMTELAEALNRMAEELSATTVSKQFLDNILASMSDPLLVVDEQGAVMLCNDAAMRELGFPGDELTGRPLATLLEQGQTGADRLLRLARMFGGSGNLEMKLATRDGRAVPVVLTGAAMHDDAGALLGIVCVAKDITKQKEVERELVNARQQAEAMARMKSSFLANMSHEIRTPLTGIIGSAQVLSGMVRGEPLELAEVIERAGLRLLQTINSVLDMARIEAGELRPRLEPVHLVEEIREAVVVLNRLATAKALTLRVAEVAEDVWTCADPAFVHRIVTNLVGNAIKFTPEGTIEVEVDRDGHDHAVLRVRDTGIGIAEDFLPLLFGEFQQESAGVARSHEGSGLGLAITRRLVELLGGTITIESVKGQGTTVTVRLELARDPASAPRPPATRAGAVLA